MNKIISYLGFAIKSKKLIKGQSHLKHYKGQIFLIIVSNSATKNLIDLANNVATKHQCELIISAVELEDLTKLKDIKIIGITDENLSNAIIKNKEIISIG